MPQLAPETFRPAERQMLKAAQQQLAAWQAQPQEPKRPEPLPERAYVVEAHVA